MNTYQTPYLICLILSIFLTVVYVKIHSRQHDIHYLAISFLIIFMNYSLYSYTQADSTASALHSIVLYYAVMVFLPPSLLRLVSSICKIKRTIHLDINLTIALIISVLILTTNHTGLFIKNYELQAETGANLIEYGIVAYIYYAFVAVNIIMMFLLSFFSKNKAKISIRCYVYVSSICFYFVASAILTIIVPGRFDFDTVASIIMQIYLIALSRRIPLYDVESVITESLEKYGDMGIIVLDKNKKLLGYDQHIEAALPDFKTYKIDKPLPESFYFNEIIDRLIDKVNAADDSEAEIFERDDHYYKFEMSKLLMNDKFCGYQLTVNDVTDRQKYIKLIEDFNTKLEDEVRSQTRQITMMQGKVILGIAEIVESRDNSTGGHIKRTSRLVEILSEEIQRENLLNVSPIFYSYLIGAAQMHDLGKVAVDDNILRKPGKFTPEEFEQMKAHAAKGGFIVGKVLNELNAPDFVEIASNIAHYHHERWDGSGYPDHLAGEDIPIEARIMAVADVYDALVSKRCYKDQFDYQKAYDIIMEGMGSQFDPQLKQVFENCVPMFEQYYNNEMSHTE